MKTFGVAETARLFKNDVETVKKWSFHFQTYLSPSANPEKGKPRSFTMEDIRVLSYVYMYWEEDHDIENINMGLNSSGHYDNKPIDDFITSLTPIFTPMPPDIDATWTGVVFGGEYELGGLFESANSFKLAGDRLIEIGLENYEERDLFQPAMYSYRHALELYIKSIIGEEINHNLNDLLSKLEKFIKEKWSLKLPGWLQDLILSFDSVDPFSTAFRYGQTVPAEELYTDMGHIKNLMGWAMQAFTNIKKEQEGPYF